MAQQDVQNQCVHLLVCELRNIRFHKYGYIRIYRGADKSLARPGRKQARKHVRDARDFNKIEKRAVIRFLFLQGKEPKEIDAILTETLACFLPGRAKDLATPLYVSLLHMYSYMFRLDYTMPSSGCSYKRTYGKYMYVMNH